MNLKESLAHTFAAKAINYKWQPVADELWKCSGKCTSCAANKAS